MGQGAAYQLVDEPTPGRLERFAVSPHWPFMAHIFGGGWLALPWYAFNSRALGSATSKRELWMAALSPAASVAFVLLAFLIIGVLGVHATPPAALLSVLGLPDRAHSYAAVFLIAIKHAFNYEIFRQQSKSFEIWSWTGGRARNGAALVAVAYVVRPLVIGAAFEANFWLGVVLL